MSAHAGDDDATLSVGWSGASPFGRGAHGEGLPSLAVFVGAGVKGWESDWGQATAAPSPCSR